MLQRNTPHIAPQGRYFQAELLTAHHVEQYHHIQGRYRQLAEGQRHAVVQGKLHTDALYSLVPLPA